LRAHPEVSTLQLEHDLTVLVPSHAWSPEKLPSLPLALPRMMSRPSGGKFASLKESIDQSYASIGDVDRNFVRAGRWGRHLDDIENFRAARRGNRNSFHCFRVSRARNGSLRPSRSITLF
jgi:hypothetical protein